MLNERKKQLQKEEVAVVKNIINIFSTNNLTYKQSVELLPEVEQALKEFSLSEKVRKVNQNH
ncbi:hypothetical protein [Oceanobacillus sp. FSL W7-1293]|uniref:hypothetical protein n=1 Tax=Oceanobacillus sp. FSL W7-1293 TaxID=2921699 RepID=UPI0030D3E82A